MTKLIKSFLLFCLAAAVLAGGFLLWHSAGGQRTIRQLLHENTELKEAITNLSAEQQIGYAKILDQPVRGGQLYTRILFVQTASGDASKPLVRKEIEIEGDVVHFDALIVRFSNELVMDGKERAICLWRRIYGEKMRPEEGFVIEQPGSEPFQYARLCSELSIEDRKLFWDEIWSLSNDLTRLEDLGISAINGNVVYRKLRPELIYIFKLSHTGAFYADIIPDL